MYNEREEELKIVVEMLLNKSSYYRIQEKEFAISKEKLIELDECLQHVANFISRIDRWVDREE